MQRAQEKKPRHHPSPLGLIVPFEKALSSGFVFRQAAGLRTEHNALPHPPRFASSWLGRSSPATKDEGEAKAVWTGCFHKDH